MGILTDSCRFSDMSGSTDEYGQTGFLPTTHAYTYIIHKHTSYYTYM